MEITDIRIRQMTSDAKMRAVVSVTFDNCFVVHDIKIIEGTDKLFIAMPSTFFKKCNILSKKFSRNLCKPLIKAICEVSSDKKYFSSGKEKVFD